MIPATASSLESGWKAQLKLRFSPRGTKTVMSAMEHIGPLRVQRPFYPETDVCHVYLLHPPGGIVGSDVLNITIQTETNSHALLTTPGSSKFYRSAGEFAQVEQSLTIDEGSFLEWFPQENILFPGAKVKIQTRINLAMAAGFMGWEMNCLGRPANKEQFEHGSLDASLKIHRDGKPLLIERQRISHKDQLTATAGLRGYPMTAVFLAYPCESLHLELARESITTTGSILPSGVTLVDNLLVLRALGHSAEALQQLMIPVWQALRPSLTGKVSVLPRIWAT